MQDLDGAVQCYQQALKCNEWSVPAMQGIACILRTKDHFPQAVEYLRTILKVDQTNGEVWGSLGTFPSYIYQMRQCANCDIRTLLLDDGRSPASVLCIPAGAVPSL